ncbi:MAG: ABC transporter ATP-binding protein [Planctomycetota bacterium]
MRSTMAHEAQYRTPPAVVVEGVWKSYERGATSTPVLRGVSLEVASGECVYLAGPSGSGKTTLLSIIGCILTPDSGSVEILGADVLALDAAARANLRRDRLGFVFQRFHLIRGLNALNNVSLPLTLRGLSRRQAAPRAMELLEAVGLADKARAQPQNLSAGQCQRVALARALAGDPDLILADEPTASLDAENGQQVMHLLRRLTTDLGKTVVVVTHDHRILHFADRVVRLENGTLSDDELGALTSHGGKAMAIP